MCLRTGQQAHLVKMAGLLGTCREQVTGDDVAILISGEHYDGSIVPGDVGGGRRGWLGFCRKWTLKFRVEGE